MPCTAAEEISRWVEEMRPYVRIPAARASRSAVRARCSTLPAAAVRKSVSTARRRTVPLTTTVNAKPEISISPETAHAAARKPSAAPSAVAAGNKYEKIRKSVLTTGWESAILQ